MSTELDEPLGIMERISHRDKEVIFLAPIFFWAKYLRRRINCEGFKPVVPEVDYGDIGSIFRAGFDLHRQANSDIEGDIVGAVLNILSKHPMRSSLFPCLSDAQIRSICGELDSMFDNQEYCALCEAWSYYDDTCPEDFAIEAAVEMLWLCGRDIGMEWFGKIYSSKIRGAIVEAVLREKLHGKIGGLLSSGEDRE